MNIPHEITHELEQLGGYAERLLAAGITTAQDLTATLSHTAPYAIGSVALARLCAYGWKQWNKKDVVVP